MSGAATRPARRARRALPPLDRARGLKALVAFGLSVGLVTAGAGIHNGVFAAMGCYIDAYGARDPYPRRGPLLVVLAAGFAVAFLAGSLAAGQVWAMVGVLSVFALGATLLVRALHLSGPGSYFVVLVAALTAFLPPVGLRDTAVRAGFLLVGATVSWLSIMSGWILRPHGPEDGAVAGALRSVAAYAEAGATDDGEDEPRVARRKAYQAVHGGWSAVQDARGLRGAALPPRLLVLYTLMLRLETVLDAVTDATERGAGRVPDGWAPLLREAAGAVAAGREPERWPTVDGPGEDAPPLPVGGPALSPELLRTARALWPRPLPRGNSLRHELGDLLSRASPSPVLALRVGLAVAVGTALGALLPVLHPAWVALGAAAALQGAHQQPVRRSWGRLTGTVVGAGVTAVVCHFFEPGVWSTVVAATLVHSVARAVPVSAMFTRMLLNTPVALLLVAAVLPAGTSVQELALYRMLDLGLGLVVGLAAAVLLPRVPVRRVCEAVARAVTAAGAAVRARLSTGTADPVAEGLAWRRMGDLWTMHAAVPAEELRSTGTADRLWPVVLAVRRLLAPGLLGGEPAPSHPAEGARTGAYLDLVAHAARQGLPGATGVRSALTDPPPAALAEHRPRLYRRLEALRRALRGQAPPAVPGEGERT
ncbi:FUSC family protein [Streptomyces sp. NPDC002734]|uniref:FUSC family protein n=1 Tax=Streptomyces sp. NPDC002734 TaxID=3154426 RepID=UPI003319DC9D